jgi:hypothetical protein
MLSGAIFVDLCSRNWVKRLTKRKVSSTDQTSSTTDSPTTSEHVPVVIRRKEMMLVFPIKGKRRLAILKECYRIYSSSLITMGCSIPLRSLACCARQPNVDIVKF